MTTMSVRNNISALNIRGNLRLAAKREGEATERLSSGYQISRASDGAAELAISEKMRGQIRGLRMSERNVEDAIALIRTADGGLAVQNDMLQRMRELALASSNDIFGDLDRSKLADEYDALMEEIDRIAENAEYNNIKLLNGSDVTSGRAASSRYKARSLPFAPLSSPIPLPLPEPAGSVVSEGDPAISTGTDGGPGSMTGLGSTNWSNINGEDLTWLRDKIVNEIAPSFVSDMLGSLDGLDFLAGTDIQVGLSQRELGGNTNGYASISISYMTSGGTITSNTFTLALQLDDDLLSDAANGVGVFTNDDDKRMLYETIGHELVHALMYVVVNRGMTNVTPDEFPSWYKEGMAQALTGEANWLTNDLSGSSTDATIKSYLSVLGNGSGQSDYGAGDLAVMYLGWKANGGGAVSTENILAGINQVMTDNMNGASLNQAFLDAVGMNVDNFAALVRTGNAEIFDFVREVMSLIGSGGAGLLLGLGNTSPNEWEGVDDEAFLKLDPNNSSVKTDFDDDVAFTGGGKTNPGTPIESDPAPSDTTPPAISIDSGSIDRLSDAQAIFDFTSDEDVEFTWLVVADGAPQPAAGDFTWSGYIVDAGESQTVLADGMSAGAKDVWLAVRDSAGNTSYMKVDLAAYEYVPPPVDETPPVITPGAAERTSNSNATVRFTGNEDAIITYYVVEDGAAQPTFGVDTPKDSFMYTGGDVGEEQTLNLTVLTAGAKDVWIRAEDPLGNISWTKIDLAEYVDTVKPTLTPGSTERVGNDAAVSFTSSEAGEYYYAVVDAGAAPPVLDTSGAGTLCGDGEQTINLTGLTPGAKDVYVAAKDAAGNVSEMIKLEVGPYVAPPAPPPGGAAFTDVGNTITITSSGDFDITEFSGHNIIIKAGLDVRLTQTGGGQVTELYIDCEAGTDLYLDNLNILNGLKDDNTIKFTGAGNTLNTIGNNKIDVNWRGLGRPLPIPNQLGTGPNSSIINVAGTTELIIGEAAGESGALDINLSYGGDGDAGHMETLGYFGAIIGSNGDRRETASGGSDAESYGKITIASGDLNINSTGREDQGAMIGNGGVYDTSRGVPKGGEILILGGEINLTRRSDAPNGAGIGGGAKTGTGIIRIEGGEINIDFVTDSDLQGAGIGTGGDVDDPDAKIYITGGVVNSRLHCTGDRSVQAAAIGGGMGSDGIEINISGGVVTASVTANDTVYSSAIGGGGYYSTVVPPGKGSTLNITGGLVIVEHGTIGGGNSGGDIGAPGETHITGGTLVIVHDDDTLQGGVTDAGGTPLYRVSVLPGEIGFPFDPGTEITMTINDTDTLTWRTDPAPYNGGMYIYLPDLNPGDRTYIDIEVDGVVYEGYAEINEDHSAVWRPLGVTPPEPPDPPPDPPPIDPPPVVPPVVVPPGGSGGGSGIPAGEDKGFVFQIGPNGGQIVTLYIPDMDSESMGIAGTSIATLESAMAALGELDLAMEFVVGVRGKLGAMQNRLEFTFATLGVTEENLADAESRIRDADMAKEMMALTKSQTLRQVGIAMLSQANQAPEMVLQLLT